MNKKFYTLKFGLLFLLVIVGNGMAYSQSWKPKPKAGFKALNVGTKPCDNIMAYTDTSRVINPCNAALDSCDSIIDWSWDFGDGRKSKLKSPANKYTQNGYFTITLKITTKYGYTDSAMLVIFIAGPQPEFIVLSDSIVEVGDSVVLKNTSLDPLYNPVWEWDFGDGKIRGDSGTRKPMQHRYNQIGTYNVYLTQHDNVNGTAQRCSVIYPDTASPVKKKITITVIQSGKVSNNSKPEISIYPNPAGDYLFIKGITKGEVIINDYQGKEVLKTEVKSNEPLDISKFIKGIYFIRCFDGNASYYKWFVKMK